MTPGLPLSTVFLTTIFLHLTANWIEDVWKANIIFLRSSHPCSFKDRSETIDWWIRTFQNQSQQVHHQRNKTRWTQKRCFLRNRRNRWNKIYFVKPRPKIVNRFYGNFMLKTYFCDLYLVLLLIFILLKYGFLELDIHLSHFLTFFVFQ